MFKMEASLPNDDNDIPAPAPKKKKTGRPFGSSKKTISKQEEMAIKRSGAVASVKERIATSNILVILPDPSSFLLPTELATQVQLDVMDVLTKNRRVHEPALRIAMTDRSYHSNYDFLELYCFHSHHRVFFPEMEGIWGSDSIRIVDKLGNPVHLFNRVIQQRKLQPLVKPGENDTYILPHVNFAIAALLREVAAYHTEPGNVSYPGICYVTMTSLLSCMKDNEEELLSLIAANFNVLLESHSSAIFKPDLLEYDHALTGDYFSFLAKLSVLFRVKIYPPTSVTKYFYDGQQVSNALSHLIKPYIDLKFPSPMKFKSGAMVKWQDLTWDNIWNYCKESLNEVTDMDRTSRTYDFVLRPIVEGAIDPNNDLLFLRKNSQTGELTAHLLDESKKFATPVAWLPPDSEEIITYQVQAYDKDSRTMQYHFFFSMNKNGAFEKL
jgi:hypothetical protein